MAMHILEHEAGELYPGITQGHHLAELHIYIHHALQIFTQITVLATSLFPSSAERLRPGIPKGRK